MQKHLSDTQWDKIKDARPSKESDAGRSGEDNRRFIEAIIWRFALSAFVFCLWLDI
jgi:putative transposase